MREKIVGLLTFPFFLAVVSIFYPHVLAIGFAYAKTEANFKNTTAEKVNFQSDSAGQWKNGEQIYRAFCIHCHSTKIGPEILGRHYPPLALQSLVRTGINTMPAFRPTEINDQELASLAKWVEQTAEIKFSESTNKGSGQ